MPLESAVLALDHAYHQLFFKVTTAVTKATAAGYLGRMHSLLDGWSGAFSECDNVGQYTEDLYADLYAQAQAKGVSAAILTKEAHNCLIELSLTYDLHAIQA